jgi:hypothetical protein
VLHPPRASDRVHGGRRRSASTGGAPRAPGQVHGGQGHPRSPQAATLPARPRSRLQGRLPRRRRRGTAVLA